MKRSFGKLLPASLAALVLASFAIAPYAEPPRLAVAAVGVGCRGRWRWWRRRQAAVGRRSRRRRHGGGGARQSAGQQQQG